MLLCGKRMRTVRTLHARKKHCGSHFCFRVRSILLRVNNNCLAVNGKMDNLVTRSIYAINWLLVNNLRSKGHVTSSLTKEKWLRVAMRFVGSYREHISGLAVEDRYIYLIHLYALIIDVVMSQDSTDGNCGMIFFCCQL